MLRTLFGFACVLGTLACLGTVGAQPPGGVRNPLLDPLGTPPSQPTQAPSAGPASTSVEKLFNLNPQQNPPPGIDMGVSSESQAKTLLARLKPLDTSILKPVEITPQAGKYCISVASYTGNDSPRMAYDFVRELREHYKLPGYAFTYGTEDKQKEYEKAKSLLEKQIRFLAENNLTAFNQKIYVRTMRLEESCAVLIGGYASDEAARRDLDRIRNLPTPNPDKVKLDRVHYGKDEDDKEPGTFRKVEETLVNPFKKAFVVRNPTVKQDHVAKKDEWDLDLLKKLNAYEPLSLLKNQKPYTLAIKQFQTPHQIVGREDTKNSGFLEAIGLGGRNAPKADMAAENAHNMAEALRKLKVDAYVLHTKFSSIVTVGGYDSVNDPAMKAMAEKIETNLRPRLELLSLFPRPLPLAVPR